jgi:undecaprenyl-phosphate 4-deoxy-4-formamido-L-arabinose transferase
MLAVAGVAFAALLFVLRMIYGPTWAVQGVFTVFAVLFVFLGVQLVGMGMLGEYIGRISRDVQGRPRYIVRERVGGAPARRDDVATPIAREARR